MLSKVDETQALLALYRQEREALDDPLDETPFPTFKEWRLKLQADRQPGDYRTVTVEQADEEMDALSVEVETNVLPTTQEMTEMNQTTDGATAPTEATTETTTPATASKAKRVRKPAVKVAKPAKKQTKADLARAIYKRLSRGKVLNREKIIAAFISEAKLSKAGAATYFQTLKGKGGKKAA